MVQPREYLHRLWAAARVLHVLQWADELDRLWRAAEGPEERRRGLAGSAARVLPQPHGPGPDPAAVAGHLAGRGGAAARARAGHRVPGLCERQPGGRFVPAGGDSAANRPQRAGNGADLPVVREEHGPVRGADRVAVDSHAQRGKD